MSAFYIWQSQQSDMCLKPMSERWTTDDLEKSFNAGMALAAEILINTNTVSSASIIQINEITQQYVAAIRAEISK